MGVYYHFGTEMARVGMGLFARIDRQGRENVPRHGPLIVVSNHMGNSDIPLVTSTVGRYIFFMAKDSLFRGPVRNHVLRGLGAFPVKRNGNDPEALLWAMQQLDRDRCVGLFPEGGRSLEGQMRRASAGVAYLALKSQAPILPVACWGSEKIRPLWRTLFAFCDMSVRVGQPFTLPKIEGNVSRAVLEHFTDNIMGRIAIMLPEQYRGYYSLERMRAQVNASDNGFRQQDGDEWNGTLEEVDLPDSAST